MCTTITENNFVHFTAKRTKGIHVFVCLMMQKGRIKNCCIKIIIVQGVFSVLSQYIKISRCWWWTRDEFWWIIGEIANVFKVFTQSNDLRENFKKPKSQTFWKVLFRRSANFRLPRPRFLQCLRVFRLPRKLLRLPYRLFRWSVHLLGLREVRPVRVGLALLLHPDVPLLLPVDQVRAWPVFSARQRNRRPSREFCPNWFRSVLEVPAVSLPVLLVWVSMKTNSKMSESIEKNC